jgi:hypothetical protein
MYSWTPAVADHEHRPDWPCVSWPCSTSVIYGRRPTKLTSLKSCQWICWLEIHALINSAVIGNRMQNSRRSWRGWIAMRRKIRSETSWPLPCAHRYPYTLCYPLPSACSFWHVQYTFRAAEKWHNVSARLPVFVVCSTRSAKHRRVLSLLDCLSFRHLVKRERSSSLQVAAYILISQPHALRARLSAASAVFQSFVLYRQIRVCRRRQPIKAPV